VNAMRADEHFQGMDWKWEYKGHKVHIRHPHVPMAIQNFVYPWANHHAAANGLKLTVLMATREAEHSWHINTGALDIMFFLASDMISTDAKNYVQYLDQQITSMEHVAHEAHSCLLMAFVTMQENSLEIGDDAYVTGWSYGLGMLRRMRVVSLDGGVYCQAPGEEPIRVVYAVQIQDGHVSIPITILDIGKADIEVPVSAYDALFNINDSLHCNLVRLMSEKLLHLQSSVFHVKATKIDGRYVKFSFLDLATTVDQLYRLNNIVSMEIRVSLEPELRQAKQCLSTVSDQTSPKRTMQPFSPNSDRKSPKRRKKPSITQSST